MPFTKDDYILCVDTRTQDADQGIVKDKTPYGTPNQDRANQSNILAVAEYQEKGKLVFQDNIDNSLPRSAIQWYFSSKTNSEYRFFLIVVPDYNNGTTYTKEIIIDEVVTTYANIIYHVASQKFFKAIATSFSGIQPTVTTNWELSWEEITNFTTEILNDKLIIHIHDELVAFHYEDCLKDKLVDVCDDILCSPCDNLEQLLPYLKAELLLYGAKSEDWQDHTDRADYIITKATEKFCC